MDDFPWLIARSIEDYDVTIKSTDWGAESFIDILGVFSGPGPNVEVNMTPKFRVPYRTEANHSDSRPYRASVIVQDDSGAPSAVIFGDSFTQWLMQFISLHFKRSVYVWSQDLDRDLIEAENPRLVLLIVTERYVPRLKLLKGPSCEPRN
jgi:hypothetical protein